MRAVRIGFMLEKTVTDPNLELEEFGERVEKIQRNLKELSKALKELKPQETRKLRGRLEKLGKLDLGLPEFQGELKSLLQKVELYAREQEKSLPLQFGRQLREAAEAAGTGFMSLTAEPPTYYLDPFTVEADFGRGVARLTYSRTTVSESPLDPKAILQEREKMQHALEGKGFEPEIYLERLYKAYSRLAKGPGDRVELVDLLPEIALLSQSEDFRKDPTRENFKPYGRVRLAFDLSRLRKSGTLVHHGKRLTLGTATIGTTRQKDRVMWLEEGQGRGQFYLTAGFQ